MALRLRFFLRAAAMNVSCVYSALELSTLLQKLFVHLKAQRRAVAQGARALGLRMLAHDPRDTVRTILSQNNDRPVFTHGTPPNVQSLDSGSITGLRCYGDVFDVTVSKDRQTEQDILQKKHAKPDPVGAYGGCAVCRECGAGIRNMARKNGFEKKRTTRMGHEKRVYSDSP